MNLNQIDRNLLLFLDPVGRYNQVSWNYFDGAACGGETLSPPDRNFILRFSRDELLNYYFTSLKMFFFSKGKYRKVLFVNDGLLSSLFDEENVSAYRAFAEKHLPKPKTFRQSIISMLPLVWRAESRFIVVFNASLQLVDCEDSDFFGLEANNFMFFSNAAGKLLFMTTKTLQTGYGELVKTTTDPEYVPVMVKEFDTVALLSEKLGKSGCLPVVGKHLEVNGRHFFTEEYILGESLRERLRELGGRRDTVQVCRILDSLDEWFQLYFASFSGKTVPVSTVYAHLFPLFLDCFGDTGASLLQAGKELLCQFGKAYPLVVPITSHNDLWPGNFVMTERGFIVIDWERATENRAPFFDYFWLVVATTIESLVSETESHDYSHGVRMFLRCADSVSCHAFQKLRNFLGGMGIAEVYLPHLLFVFFMEWSVQGFQVLGRQTDMDRLAFGELLYYAENMNTAGICLASVDRLVSESENA